jgi:Xaa-Pro aminopeptidase
MIINRLTLLREKMAIHGFDGYLVPSNDEYLSEYTPLYAKRLEYITGFTGSNGLALVLKNTVLFFTDGRYLTQCQTELNHELFSIYSQQLISSFVWDDFMDEQATIGYDPKLFTQISLQKFSRLNLKDYTPNLIDEIWANHPPKPNSKIFDYPLQYAGLDWKYKIQQCRSVIQENHADALVICDPASVCWLFNIRASDVEFSPLLLANMILTRDKTYLFTDEKRFNAALVRDELIILPESDFPQIINTIGNNPILFDHTQCSIYLSSIIERHQFKHISNPCMLWKACKSPIEIDCMKQGHIQDAVAVCEMLSFISSEDISSLSEYDLGLALTKFRGKREGYIYDSFPTICGFQENGAIIHYRANQNKAKKINGNGLLLIDSGAQYLGATTDITRTVAIGKIKPDYKKFYTYVLKGHIALAMAKFPQEKVTGANLDILARQYLWQSGLDYAHGTGHGVGSFLSVHEGPQSISLTGYGAQIKAGMVLSNEPGYYLPGELGIRIENLMFTKNSVLPEFLEFEMLTLVPYAKELIDFTRLNPYETSYLKKYYQAIDDNISSILSTQAKLWLKNQLDIFT